MPVTMPRRRRLVAALAGAGLVLVVVAAAGWYDVSQARAGLNAARATLEAVSEDPTSLRTAGGRAAARTDTEAAVARIEAAGGRIDRSLPLRVASLVPALSAQRRGAAALVDDAGSGARIGLRLLRAVDRLAEEEGLVGGTVPLDGLRRMREALRSAGSEVAATRQPAHGLWGPLGGARRALNRMADRTSERLREAADGLEAAEAFLGAGGPRKYLLAVQNNAEMRDQGMVLSYALVDIDAGRLHVTRSGSIVDLVLDEPIGYPVPEGMSRIFGGLEPNRLWQSVNASADFAWSGRAMAEMVAQSTGTPVDGVIAIDVPGLAALLAVVGPVSVEGVEGEITAENAAAVLLDRLYKDFPRGRDQADRRERLGAVAQALIERLATGSFDAVEVGSALGGAAATGHLRLWSADAGEEARFERSGLGGGPGLRSPERTFRVSVQNATATKLDYFVKPRVNMRVSLTPEGAAVVQTEVAVVNDAPVDAPDSYQFGPDGAGQAKAAQYIARVYFWGPKGAEQADSVAESGLRLNQGPTTVDAGETGIVRFQTVIPRAVRDGRLDLRLVPQARLWPMGLRVTLSAPGWEVEGPLVVEPEWDRALTVSWNVHT